GGCRRGGGADGPGGGGSRPDISRGTGVVPAPEFLPCRRPSGELQLQVGATEWPAAAEKKVRPDCRCGLSFNDALIECPPPPGRNAPPPPPRPLRLGAPPDRGGVGGGGVPRHPRPPFRH